MRIVVTRHKQEFIFEVPHTVCWPLRAIGERVVLERIVSATERYPVEASLVGDGRSLLVGDTVYRLNAVHGLGCQSTVKRPVEPKRKAQDTEFGDIKSPMTGKIISIAVQVGDTVRKGDVLAIVEAMKMENRIQAKYNGTVTHVATKAGNNVTTGEVLLTVGPGSAV